MTSTRIHRELAGVATGGRFAAFSHPEDGTLELGGDPVAADDVEDDTVTEWVDRVISLLVRYRESAESNRRSEQAGYVGDRQGQVYLCSEMRMITGVDIIEGNSSGYDAITEALGKAKHADSPRAARLWTQAAQREATWMIGRQDAYTVARHAASRIAEIESEQDAAAAQPSAATDLDAEERRADAVDLGREEDGHYMTLMKATTVDTPAPIARAAWTKALDDVGPYGQAKADHERANWGSRYDADRWAGDLRYACKAAEVRIEQERRGATIEDSRGLSQADLAEHLTGTSSWKPRDRPRR